MGQREFGHGGEPLRLTAWAKQSDRVLVRAERGVFAAYRVGHYDIEVLRGQLGLGVGQQIVGFGGKADDDARPFGLPELSEDISGADQLNVEVIRSLLDLARAVSGRAIIGDGRGCDYDVGIGRCRHAGLIHLVRPSPRE